MADTDRTPAILNVYARHGDGTPALTLEELDGKRELVDYNMRIDVTDMTGDEIDGLVNDWFEATADA